MKGSRSARAALVATLVSLVAAGSGWAQVPTPEAREQMLTLLQERSLHRERVDWVQLRRELASADEARQRTLLLEAIEKVSDGHGRWLTIEEVAQEQRRKAMPAPASASAGRPAAAATPDAVPVPVRLGLIRVGAYISDRTAAPRMQREQDLTHAADLQRVIRRQDDGSRCGWIVDLRGNGGGNMWPMLLGIAPLLAGDGSGDGFVGNFQSSNGSSPWRVRDGAVWNGETAYLFMGEGAYRLRRPDAPVAVLLSGRTASSGEAIALAFRGRPATRSFGSATAGYSTGNSPTTLVDGSLLLLTGSVMQDRFGHGNGARITPDVLVEGAGDAMQAASEWLLSQPACQARP